MTETAHSLSEIILQAVEEWKKNGRLPNGQEWKPEDKKGVVSNG